MYTLPFEQESKDRRKHTYSVVIYLPKNLDDIIMPFRERFDPNYNLIPGHLTLVFPFESKLTLDDISQTIKATVDDHPPINIELDSIADFYPQVPFIYWSVTNQQVLCDLYFQLYSKLELPIPFKKLIPHVTIASEISNHRVETIKDEIATYLPQEKFVATSIDLITPLVNEKWVSVRSFSFKK